jgi:predicted enzyme related to lactoylglutathione lyase
MSAEPKPASMMVGSATVFTVRDIAASRDHFRDVHGFAITFEWGTPLHYICMCREEVQLHLLSAAGTTRQPGQSGLCVFVRDVDALYAELKARGANILKPPESYAYGMRDFDAIDLDGNQITYGMGVNETEK